MRNGLDGPRAMDRFKVTTAFVFGSDCGTATATDVSSAMAASAGIIIIEEATAAISEAAVVVAPNNTSRRVDVVVF